MRFFRISDADLPRWQSELEALEHRSVYPLGADTFTISHGADYFAFFRRMGAVHYHALEDGGRLVAVGCGVLRDEPRRWYGADLKVHPDYRGRHLPLRMANRLFLPHFLRCPRGYGVAMDPPGGEAPATVRLLRHFKWLRVAGTIPLRLYSADFGQMRAALPALVAARGPLHFISLAGIKDLTLASTGKPLPLLHVGYGTPRPGDRIFTEPQPGHTHMWCTPDADPTGLPVAATATILHHGLHSFDWRRLTTAEI